ncbi:hypothetical protein DFA_11765 [Cavenderia fasciculata]|uniref:Uncharacterized protein n=1 Tax=Cavenderia fasciculata TaxID=261658 RepID=F4QE57_CACFS|nr:uncharacterized protein DFA_11765 [Cavenderia fasciculata]EGG14004.1 hypothetical protein DFA_11765 [Cavenderia fasciculata]|eukprot:XP_004350712.1 hypothetical protein DFA_11765 [Cavenderia fasciculata]
MMKLSYLLALLIVLIAIVNQNGVNGAYRPKPDGPRPNTSPCCNAVYNPTTRKTYCNGPVKKTNMLREARCIEDKYFTNVTGVYECEIGCSTLWFTN